ncbi:putative endothelin-converting enzyme 1 [Helianthus annuus]|nr:putative endothelin-converting enzyme 1 [Helianthus annuus]
MGETEKASEAKRTTVGPASVLAYLDPNYWNERFTSEDHYEWLKDYSHFRHLIHQHIKPDSSVLELGCGNSQLSDELYNDGITNITCIDLSSVAVEKMQKRFFSKGYKGFCIYFLYTYYNVQCGSSL